MLAATCVVYGRALLQASRHCFEVNAVVLPRHRGPDDAGASGWFALLRQHLVLVVAVKLVLLALLFLLFFSATHRPAPGPAAVSERLHLPR